ncbi:hypothetical protein MK786_05785 [Microbacterium sp. CFH 31415]|uniref:hypothetical protein n=1 Tax=Microbacterium sp. CFH 31415 TaxID=2921732 RepID=UPI001F13777A|nr:hypothetical protein [Microbacterium sp. CFH 31415]MCH6230243.1 hypothetical protein [Microbacterium sp. CFH 31415]
MVHAHDAYALHGMAQNELIRELELLRRARERADIEPPVVSARTSKAPGGILFRLLPRRA